MNRRRAALLLPFFTWLLLSASPAEAWSGTGHMLVAEIAYHRLDPDTRQEADRLIRVLAELDPKSDHFVPASVWMDRIKRTGLDAFDPWHYVNLPLGKSPETFPSLPPGPHVVWAIERSMTTLADHPTTENDFSKALMLRVLIHLVGDVHQPLHAATRMSPELPQGDRGGNDFILSERRHPFLLSCPETSSPEAENQEPKPDRQENLHSFWDRGAFALPETRWPSDAPCLTALAAEIQHRFPPESVPHWTRDDPTEWARESHRLAASVAYEGTQPGRAPSAAYIREAQPVVLRRIAVAGYRLAAALESVLGSR